MPAGPLQARADASAAVARLRALQSSADGPPIQRYIDLQAYYADIPDFAGKADWIERFTHAQQVLNDQGLVDASLTKLAGEMVENDNNLHKAIERAMLEHWGKQDHALTGFVPESTFLGLLRDGKLFRDYVNKAHGVHTHQIQWYILYDHFRDKNLVFEMFREAGNPRWLKEGKYMWDRVVDGLGAGVNPTDFTIPDNLEKYIDDKHGVLVGAAEQPVVDDVHAAHESQRDKRSVYHDRAPGEWRYSAAMRDAKRVMTDPNSTRLQKEAVLRGIENETITNITREEGEIKIITWTGWIKGDGDNPDPYFIPTVAHERF